MTEQYRIEPLLRRRDGAVLGKIAGLHPGQVEKVIAELEDDNARFLKSDGTLIRILGVGVQPEDRRLPDSGCVVLCDPSTVVKQGDLLVGVADGDGSCPDCGGTGRTRNGDGSFAVPPCPTCKGTGSPSEADLIESEVTKREVAMKSSAQHVVDVLEGVCEYCKSDPSPTARGIASDASQMLANIVGRARHLAARGEILKAVYADEVSRAQNIVEAALRSQAASTAPGVVPGSAADQQLAAAADAVNAAQAAALGQTPSGQSGGVLVPTKASPDQQVASLGTPAGRPNADQPGLAAKNANNGGDVTAQQLQDAVSTEASASDIAIAGGTVMAEYQNTAKELKKLKKQRAKATNPLEIDRLGAEITHKQMYLGHLVGAI